MDDDFISQKMLHSMILKPPAHKIANLKPYMKNIEIQAIILEIKEKVFLRNQNQYLTKFLIADETGSILFNIFDSIADELQLGDIIYVHNSYTTKFQDQMILYHGKMGMLKKIDEFYFQWQEHPFVSKMDWSQYTPGNNNLQQQQQTQHNYQNNNQNQQQSGNDQQKHKQSPSQSHFNKDFKQKSSFSNSNQKSHSNHAEPKLKKKIKNN